MKEAVKIIGGILLIVGTSIGGGMLALPVANAEVGFPVATFLLLICWLTMTFSALLILEVNLALPPGSNMITMAKATLGKPGEIIAWLSYLFLLYSLLAAYISGGADVLQSIFSLSNLPITFVPSVFIFVGLLGAVVYRGIKSVDYVNIGLMIAKLSVYVLLILMITPYVDLFNLEQWDIHPVLAPIMLLITSFGYAIIIPSLRTYFNDDAIALRKVILIGSLIPLIAYLLWDAVIMGALPHYGKNSLSEILHGGHATTQLTAALNEQLKNSWITDFFRFFTSISMLTAFLGVALSLSDFLADGLHLKKMGKQGSLVFALTFIPPIIIVLFYPTIFIKALGYGGIFCVILLMLLPLLMAWSARYRCHLQSPYRVRCGKFAIISATVIAIVFLIIGLIEEIQF